MAAASTENQLNGPGDVVAKWFQGKRPNGDLEAQSKSVISTPTSAKQLGGVHSTTPSKHQSNGMDSIRLQSMLHEATILGRSGTDCSSQDTLLPERPIQDSSLTTWLTDRFNSVQGSLDHQMSLVMRSITTLGSDMEHLIKREFFNQQKYLIQTLSPMEGALDVLISEGDNSPSNRAVERNFEKELTHTSTVRRDEAVSSLKYFEEAINEMLQRANEPQRKNLPSCPSVHPLQSTKACPDPKPEPCAMSRGNITVEREIMKQHNERMAKEEKLTMTSSALKQLFRVQNKRLAKWNKKPKTCWVHFVDGAVFGLSVVCVTVANAAWMGYETNEHVRRALEHPSQPDEPYWRHINNTFSVLFALELFIRMYALRQAFFLRHDWPFNFYDLIVVIASMAEMFPLNTFAKFWRTMRVIRIVRVLRIVRIVHIFDGLRYVGLTILACTTHVFWLLLVVLFLIFMFSIAILQMIILSVGNNHENDEQYKLQLKRHWGTMGSTMFSLGLSVSGGMEWGRLADEIRKSGWFCEVLLTLYVFSVSFGFLSAVIGVFVDKTLELKTRDHNLAIHSERRLTRSFFNEMRRLFEDEGISQDTLLDWISFEANLNRTDVQLYLQAQNIDVAEACELFKLLDHDNIGKVSIDDFVHGCLRIRGPAKGLDMVLLFEQVSFMKHKQTELHDHQKSLEHHVTAIAALLHKELVELRVEFADMERQRRLKGDVSPVRRSMIRRSNSATSVGAHSNTESHLL